MDRRSSTGRPLAGSAWLAAHHRAKLPERRAFAEGIAALRPSRIVDLGCAGGLWLQELDGVLPESCEFIGLDADENALTEATARATSWRRTARFEQIDLTDESQDLPVTDVALLFNVSSYIPNLDALLARLATSSRQLVIRQYDGAALRFGPMNTEDRALIEESLRAAVGRSAQFRHYDLDRVYAAIHAAPYANRDIAFETFARTAPFPPEFLDYYDGTLDWTRDFLSHTAVERLDAWRAMALSTYFSEVDLVAVLS